MSSFNHRITWGSVGILLAATIFLASMSAPSYGEASRGSSESQETLLSGQTQDIYSTKSHTISLRGRFAVIVGDPLYQSVDNFLSPQYIYVLRHEAGKTITLDLSLLDFAVDPWSLNGDYVQVSGRQNEQGDVLQITNIQSIHDHTDRNTNDVIGQQPMLVLLCKFPDVQENLEPPAYFEGLFDDQFPGLGHYWQEVSYGQSTLAPIHVVGWSEFPHPLNYYVDPLNLPALNFDCLDTAPKDIDFDDYAVVNQVYNSDIGACYGGGGGLVSWGATHLGPGCWRSHATVAHEIGHAFLLPHSAGPDGVYSSGWDVMSVGGYGCKLSSPIYGCLGQHTISYHKDRLGWLAEGRILEVTPDSSHEVVLSALSQVPSGQSYLMIKIPLSDSGKVMYTVEARQPIDYDKNTPGAGIVIHRVDGNQNVYGELIPAIVVDKDGNGNVNDNGAIWEPGETFLDPVSGVEVSVLNKEGTGYRVSIKMSPRPEFACSKNFDVPEKECDGLMTIYQNLNGNSWTDNSGWGKWLDVCNWKGVNCHDFDVHNHVFELDLGGNNLTGSIPSQIGESLVNLTYLGLSQNNLSGPLPSTLGNLKNLESLYVSDNILTGSIPPVLGGLKNLQNLYLARNNFQGAIPVELGQLPLWYVDLSDNQLTGGIPAEFGDLNELFQLNVANNPLSYPLPREIMEISSLDTFRFDNTSICHPPDSIFQEWLSSIRSVDGTGLYCPSSLESNHDVGAPGSFFSVSGTMFETDATADIMANGTKIGEVATNGEGELVFTLKTSNADEGQYTIRVTTAELSTTLPLKIDTQSPLRPRQGNSPLINLPGGLAATATPTATPDPESFFIFLPQVLTN